MSDYTIIKTGHWSAFGRLTYWPLKHQSVHMIKSLHSRWARYRDLDRSPPAGEIKKVLNASGLTCECRDFSMETNAMSRFSVCKCKENCVSLSVRFRQFGHWYLDKSSITNKTNFLWWNNLAADNCPLLELNHILWILCHAKKGSLQSFLYNTFKTQQFTGMVLNSLFHEQFGCFINEWQMRCFLQPNCG